MKNMMTGMVTAARNFIMRTTAVFQYCAYHAVPPAKRLEVLYGIIVNAKEKSITLEAIMQHGNEELPALEEFLSLWIIYLGDKTGHTAERLILEAVSLLNDISLKVQYAEKYAAVYPGLYLNILKTAEYVIASNGKLSLLEKCVF